MDIVWTGTEYGVAWTARSPGGRVDAFFQRVSGAGVAIGLPTNFTSSLGGAAFVDVVVAHGSSGYLAVVAGGGFPPAMDGGAGDAGPPDAGVAGSGTWYAMLADDGTLTTAPVLIDSATPSWMDAAASPSGFALAWGSSTGAYVRTFAQDGTAGARIVVPSPEEDVAIIWDGTSWVLAEAGQLGAPRSQLVLLRGPGFATRQVVDDVGVSGDPGGGVSLTALAGDVIVSWRHGGGTTYPLHIQRYSPAASATAPLVPLSTAPEVIVATGVSGTAITYVTSSLVMLGWSDLRTGTTTPEAYAIALGVGDCTVTMP
jgi:hypothetical protein